MKAQCKELVKRQPNGRITVYKSEKMARKYGARVCGGELQIEEDSESFWGTDSGMSDHGRWYDQFSGFVVKCPRCGHVVARWNKDDLEQMVKTSWERSQQMPEYSRYRMN